MKTSSFLIWVALLMAGSAVAPALGASSGQIGKSVTPTLSREQNAKLTELKRQQAANAVEIERLRAKINQDSSLRPAHARKDQSAQSKDSISDMSSQDQLKLQQMMDRKTKLEDAISRIMKEASETANQITGNMK